MIFHIEVGEKLVPARFCIGITDLRIIEHGAQVLAHRAFRHALLLHDSVDTARTTRHGIKT